MQTTFVFVFIASYRHCYGIWVNENKNKNDKWAAMPQY